MLGVTPKPASFHSYHQEEVIQQGLSKLFLLIQVYALTLCASFCAVTHSFGAGLHRTQPCLKPASLSAAEGKASTDLAPFPPMVKSSEAAELLGAARSGKGLDVQSGNLISAPRSQTYELWDLGKIVLPLWSYISPLSDEQEVGLMMGEVLTAIMFQDALRLSLGFQSNQGRAVSLEPLGFLFSRAQSHAEHTFKKNNQNKCQTVERRI